MFVTFTFVGLIESGMCMRQCCGKDRGFIMHIVNNYTQVAYICTLLHLHLHVKVKVPVLTVERRGPELIPDSRQSACR